MARASTFSPIVPLAWLFAVLTPVCAGAQPASAGSQAAAPGNDPGNTGSASPSPSPPPEALPFRPSNFNLSVLGGRGLIRARSPYTLPSGQVAVGGSVLNFDRNPGDTDFMDFGFQLALGLSRHTEVFLRVSPVLRTNSVGLDPVGFPVPPLDLFIDTYPTPAVRTGPVFLFAQEVPYKAYDARTVLIDPPSHGAFAQSSGDITIGGKWNFLSEDRRDRLGLGVRAYADIPTEKPKYNTPQWRDVNGVSGKGSIGLDLLGAKRLAGTEVLVNIGYEHVGDPDRGLRIQFVDSSRPTSDGFLVGAPQEVKLDLHDQLTFTSGVSFPLKIWKQEVWLLGEFDHTRYIGHGIPVERIVSPTELRVGLQLFLPWYKSLALGLAAQMLFIHAGDGDMRATFLHAPDGRGDINFSDNVDPALASQVRAFLTSRGASTSDNSSRVFSTNNAAFDEWRNISTAPKRVVAQGNTNFLISITWRVNLHPAPAAAK